MLYTILGAVQLSSPVISTLIANNQQLSLCGFMHIAYRTLHDPLSDTPGPRYAAFSRLPWVWYTLTGQRILWIQSLHEKYGTVVRVAPDEISFVDAKAWRDIYDKTANLPKDPAFYETSEGPDDPHILVANDSDHARMRYVMLSYAMSNSH